MTNILSELKIELDKITTREQKRECCLAVRAFGGQVEYRGKLYTDCASWNVLNLASHKKVLRAQLQAVEQAQGGIASPRTLLGTTPYHARAEEHLARFFGVESALILPTKNQAILSLVTALMNERDLLIVDAYVQSPYADAASIVGATVETFSTLANLTALLDHSKSYRRVYICIESLRGATGDSAPLHELVELSRKYGAELCIDESYAFSMLGIRGAGLGEVIALKRNELPHHMHLLTLVDLSVALGIPGTAIVSSKILIEYLVQTLSSLTSDTPPSVSDVAAIPVALELLEFMHLERERIKLLVQKLYDGIGTSYTVVGTAPLGSFVTVRFPKLNQARLFHRALLERGFITDVYPLGLPLSEESAVRFVLRSDFTDKTVDMILDTLHEIRKRGA